MNSSKMTNARHSRSTSLRSLPLVALSLAVFSTGVDARQTSDLPETGQLGGPGRVLNEREMAQWLRGRELFDRPMHRSRGLGAPGLNADSCRGCHQDPILGGSGGLELNVSRFARDNGGAGPFVNLTGGQGLSKFYPPWQTGREEHPGNADVFEQRQTPSIFGDGMIETILDAAILANEDPLDADGDGIFGVARMVNVGGGVLEIGRFGWKAQVPSLMDFTRDAMGGELGITTPDDTRGFAMLSDADTVPDPELTEQEVDDIAFFMRELAAPQRRGPAGPIVVAGESLFAEVGCAKCHVPQLQGSGGMVPLYSNLLLHDVMPSNYRGMSEPGAGSGMFRTPPLWGIRHTAPYMHDGRAETLADAIAHHKSEADGVRIAYEQLAPADQQALLRFLKSL